MRNVNILEGQEGVSSCRKKKIDKKEKVRERENSMEKEEERIGRTIITFSKACIDIIRITEPFSYHISISPVSHFWNRSAYLTFVTRKNSLNPLQAFLNKFYHNSFSFPRYYFI